MATAEKKTNGTLGPCGALMAALCLTVSAPLPAQDQPAGSSATNTEDTQTPDNAPVPRVFVRSAADAGALAQQYPHLAVWLEPEDAPRVLGLVERETTATPSGAMVILAGEGQSANDGLLEGLRGRLSKAGWAAMTMGLEQPSPSLQLARERLEKASPPASDDSETGEQVMIDVNDQAAMDLLERHREAINGQLAAAVAWFGERDYRRIVLVGVGRGADEIRGFLAEAPPEVRQAAWVAADFGAQAPDGISASFGDNAPLPLLDLYSSRADRAPDRAAAFRRSGVGGYESLAAPVAVRPSARDAGAIASRLIGWAAGS